MKKKVVATMFAMLLLVNGMTVFAASGEGAIQPMDNCTSWVFHQTSTSCTDPLCGPGAILHTKYLKGYRDRTCNSTGYEKKPYTKIKPGCC